jgi:hypothetical protein
VGYLKINTIEIIVKKMVFALYVPIVKRTLPVSGLETI